MDDLTSLVVRAQEGDRDAFGRLYGRLARPVLLQLVALLGRQDDAEDALQATFLKAWTSLAQLSAPERFAPWLFRTARNTGHDLARRRHRRRRHLRLLSRDAIDRTAAPVPHDEGDVLRRLVQELKPETRSIVLLRAVEGWSAEEVAVALGVHPATVRRRYARALGHLRRRWTRLEEDRA